MTTPAATDRPWRLPVLWLAAGMPLLVIVASVVTLRLAASERSDSTAADVRRIAQIQLEDLAPDRYAQQQGYAAEVVVDAANGTLQLLPNAQLPVTDGVVLEMLHPLDASLDRRLDLQLRDGHWSVRTQHVDGQAWQLRLASARSGWRLRGVLARGKARALLRPGVDGDG